MFTRRNLWECKSSEIRADVSYTEKMGSVLPNPQGGKMQFSFSLPLQSVMEYNFFCFEMDLFVMHRSRKLSYMWQRNEKEKICWCNSNAIWKKKQKTKRLSCMKWECLLIFLNASQWHFWSKCQYVTLHGRVLLPAAEYNHEKRECFAVLPSSPFEDARGLHKS